MRTLGSNRLDSKSEDTDMATRAARPAANISFCLDVALNIQVIDECARRRI